MELGALHIFQAGGVDGHFFWREVGVVLGLLLEHREHVVGVHGEDGVAGFLDYALVLLAFAGLLGLLCGGFGEGCFGWREEVLGDFDIVVLAVFDLEQGAGGIGQVGAFLEYWFDVLVIGHLAEAEAGGLFGFEQFAVKCAGGVHKRLIDAIDADGLADAQEREAHDVGAVADLCRGVATIFARSELEAEQALGPGGDDEELGIGQRLGEGLKLRRGLPGGVGVVNCFGDGGVGEGGGT